MALAGDVANLIVALRLDDRGFTGKLNAAAAQLNRMDRGLSQMGRGTGQLASGIGRIATVAAAAAAGGLAAVVTTAASFEQAWAGVTKTVEGANEELLNEFKQLSREVPLSFEELAAIGAEGGALGIATEDLIAFTDVVARLAFSTDLTASAAATAIGHLSNVLDLGAEDIHDLGDSLVALGNDGASTESEIIGLAERFGAAAHQAGLSTEAILALSSTTASMGIEAEAGGGALSRVFNGITLNIATANEKGEELAEAMGLSLAELRTAWDKDAGAVFGDLLETLGELDKFGRVELLKGLGITNSRDVAAITALADGVDEYNRQLGVSVGQTDELNRESQAFIDTTQGMWEILKNNVRLAADTIGSELLPIINELGDEFIEFLGRPGNQAGLTNFAKDLAAGVRGVVEQIRNADFGPLLDTFRIAGGIAKAGFDAFRALPPGVQALALAAIGVNKLTGGALTQIAAGMGNILGGALKLAIPALNRGQTALNPMYVKEVGLRGGPNGPPIGGAGWLAAALAFLGGVVLPVIAVAQLSPSSNANNTQQIEQQRLVTNLWERGLLTDTQYQTLFKLAYEGVDISAQLPSDLEVRVAGLNEALSDRNERIANNRAAEDVIRANQAWSDRLTAQVEQLPDAAMLAPGVQALTTNLPQLPSILGELKGVKGTEQQQLQKQAEGLAAARSGNSKLDSLLLKKSSVTVITNVTANVRVAASQVAQSITTTQRSIGGGQYDNSAGI